MGDGLRKADERVGRRLSDSSKGGGAFSFSSPTEASMQGSRETDGDEGCWLGSVSSGMEDKSLTPCMVSTGVPLRRC